MQLKMSDTMLACGVFVDEGDEDDVIDWLFSSTSKSLVRLFRFFPLFKLYFRQISTSSNKSS